MSSVRERPALRTAFAAAFLLSALFLPWGVTAAVALLALFAATAYEIPLLALIPDLLYFAPADGLAGFPFLMSSATLLAFLGIEFAKRRLLPFAP